MPVICSNRQSLRHFHSSKFPNSRSMEYPGVLLTWIHSLLLHRNWRALRFTGQANFLYHQLSLAGLNRPTTNRRVIGRGDFGIRLIVHPSHLYMTHCHSMTENVRRGSVILIITQRAFHIPASLDPMGTFATLAPVACPPPPTCDSAEIEYIWSPIFGKVWP